MTRDRFRDLFISATDRVLEFTRQFVWNDLPDTLRYLVYPNWSHDLDAEGRSLTTIPKTHYHPATPRGL